MADADPNELLEYSRKRLVEIVRKFLSELSALRREICERIEMDDPVGQVLLMWHLTNAAVCIITSSVNMVESAYLSAATEAAKKMTGLPN